MSEGGSKDGHGERSSSAIPRYEYLLDAGAIVDCSHNAAAPPHQCTEPCSLRTLAVLHGVTAWRWRWRHVRNHRPHPTNIASCIPFARYVSQQHSSSSGKTCGSGSSSGSNSTTSLLGSMYFRIQLHYPKSIPSCVSFVRCESQHHPRSNSNSSMGI